MDNPFLIAILLLPAVAIAAGFFIYGLRRGWELRRSPVSALATALLMPAAFFAWPWLGQAAAFVHFLQDRPIYEEIVRKEADGDAYENMAYRGIEYRVDRSGGVERIAFVTNPGVTDNWTAIIYDPTGKVALARGMRTAPSDVLMLFGGDLVACGKLAGDFYSCSFT